MMPVCMQISENPQSAPPQGEAAAVLLQISKRNHQIPEEIVGVVGLNFVF